MTGQCTIRHLDKTLISAAPLDAADERQSTRLDIFLRGAAAESASFMTHRVWPCPTDGFAQPPLLDVFALPSAVGTLSPSAGSAGSPQQAPAGDHNRAALQAQDNIKTEIEHLECTQHGKHRHQLGWFRGSEVQRFGGSEVQRSDADAKDGGNHGLCLHGADLGWGGLRDDVRRCTRRRPSGNRRGAPP